MARLPNMHSHKKKTSISSPDQGPHDDHDDEDDDDKDETEQEECRRDGDSVAKPARAASSTPTYARPRERAQPSLHCGYIDGIYVAAETRRSTRVRKPIEHFEVKEPARQGTKRTRSASVKRGRSQSPEYEYDDDDDDDNWSSSSAGESETRKEKSKPSLPPEEYKLVEDFFCSYPSHILIWSKDENVTRLRASKLAQLVRSLLLSTIGVGKPLERHHWAQLREHAGDDVFRTRRTLVYIHVHGIFKEGREWSTKEGMAKQRPARSLLLEGRGLPSHFEVCSLKLENAIPNYDTYIRHSERVTITDALHSVLYRFARASWVRQVRPIEDGWTRENQDPKGPVVESV